VSSTATLAYSATARGPVSVAALAAAMAAVAIDYTQIQEVTGAVETSDQTASTGQVVTRTIIFGITSAQFQSQFPAGTDQAQAFRGLYTQQLSQALDTYITETPVVIA
jgi:hypothetical protein